MGSESLILYNSGTRLSIFRSLGLPVYTKICYFVFGYEILSIKIVYKTLSALLLTYNKNDNPVINLKATELLRPNYANKFNSTRGQSKGERGGTAFPTSYFRSV